MLCSSDLCNRSDSFPKVKWPLFLSKLDFVLAKLDNNLIAKNLSDEYEVPLLNELREKFKVVLQFELEKVGLTLPNFTVKDRPILQI